MFQLDEIEVCHVFCASYFFSLTVYPNNKHLTEKGRERRREDGMVSE